jgi:hypothetical protein
MSTFQQTFQSLYHINWIDICTHCNLYQKQIEDKSGYAYLVVSNDGICQNTCVNCHQHYYFKLF